MAAILGKIIYLLKFSFAICGKKLVQKMVKNRTIAGWKLPTRKTIVTGASNKAKFVKRFPEIVINSLATFTIKIFFPPALVICINCERSLGTNKKINKPEIPRPAYSQKHETQKLFPMVTYLNKIPESATKKQAISI